MRFGKSETEAAEEAPRGGGDFIRYLKDGDTIFRIVQEPKDWVYYWEHFNPDGFSFPCTNDKDTCPGCTSNVEKMKKVGRKIAFNALQTVGGEEYVNVWKVPATLADKLKNRAERNGTITDRDYRITRYKTANDKVEYDIEGEDKTRVDVSKYQMRDIEELLAAAYEESWGDPNKAKVSNQRAEDAARNEEIKEKLVEREATQPTDPPSEPSADPKAEGEITVTEDDLRKMDPMELMVICVQEFRELPPREIATSDQIVDWMMVHS